LDPKQAADNSGPDVFEQRPEEIDRPALVLDQRVPLAIGFKPDRGP
jgi:hypothetical protein